MQTITSRLISTYSEKRLRSKVVLQNSPRTSPEYAKHCTTAHLLILQPLTTIALIDVRSFMIRSNSISRSAPRLKPPIRMRQRARFG